MSAYTNANIYQMHKCAEIEYLSVFRTKKRKMNMEKGHSKFTGNLSTT